MFSIWPIWQAEHNGAEKNTNMSPEWVKMGRTYHITIYPVILKSEKINNKQSIKKSIKKDILKVMYFFRRPKFPTKRYLKNY